MDTFGIDRKCAERAADTVVRSLNHFLEHERLPETGARIAITDVEHLPNREKGGPYHEKEAAGRELHFSRADGLSAKGRLFVVNRWLGLYDVYAGMSGQAEARLNVVIPNHEAPPCRTATRMEEIFQHLIEQLDRGDGERSPQAPAGGDSEKPPGVPEPLPT